MGVSRELMESSENGVQVWICSNCGWKRPYPLHVPEGQDSANGLLRELGRVSQSAYRTSEKFELMLKTPRTRMMFLSCLADRFGLGVDFGEDGSVRLSTPPPINEKDIDYRVPNVIQIAEDGSVVPIDYELKDESSEDKPAL